MCPAKVKNETVRGWIIPVGGGEKKVRSSPILRKLVELSGDSEARMVIVPTASQLDDAGDRTRDVFREMGVQDIQIVRTHSTYQTQE